MLSIEQLIENQPEASIKALEDATGIAYDGNNIDFLYATGKKLYQKLYDEIHKLHKLDTETFNEYKDRIREYTPPLHKLLKRTFEVFVKVRTDLTYEAVPSNSIDFSVSDD